MHKRSLNRKEPQRLRVLFAAGNGDVAGTLKQWTDGCSDDRIIAKAYSAELYDLATTRSWRLFCFQNNPANGARAGQIAVIPLPKPPAHGVHYIFNEVRYGWRIARLARRLKADAIIIATGLHTLGYLGLSMCNKPIIVSKHNTFWAREETAPRGTKGFLLRYLAGRLRGRIDRVVAVSDEIRLQVIRLWRLDPDRVRVHIPQYNHQGMPWTEPSEFKPYRILFAGRAETGKGIDDIIQAAEIVEREHPGLCRWIVAGDGSSLDAHRAHAKQIGVEHLVEFLGQIRSEALTEEIHKCRMTITPTRPSFNEGLAKLPLEGAIMGRPALASTVVPALDLLAEAAEAVKPSNPRDIADAVTRLCEDSNLYDKRRTACKRIREMTDDPTLGFQRAIADAFDSLSIREH